MGGTVLIVDGVAASRIVLAGRLVAGCYRTIPVATGAEALRLARAEAPDILLTDLALPDMTGIELCRLLRADPATRALPVICIDSGPNGDQRCAALRAGADDILTKPIGEAMLLARLRSLLRASEIDEPPGLRETTRQALGLAEQAAPYLPPPPSSDLAGGGPWPALRRAASGGATLRGGGGLRRTQPARGPRSAPRPATDGAIAAPMAAPGPHGRPQRWQDAPPFLPAPGPQASLTGPGDIAGAAPMAAAQPDPGRIAILSADRARALRWCLRLTPHLTQEIVALSSAEALSLRDETMSPDVFLVLLDQHQPQGGLNLLSELRARGATRRSAILCLLDPEDEGRAAMALDLGAADLVRADYRPEETALRLRQQLLRKRAADRRRASLRDGLALAVTDPLTGLANRRYAMASLAGLMADTPSDQDGAGGPAAGCAVLLLDLDGFKAVNDSFGHPAGDAVLTGVAHLLARHMRPGDLVARMGGEEFLIARAGVSEADALALAEQLRESVASRPFRVEDGTDRLVPVTVSIGVAHAAPGVPAADMPAAASGTQGRTPEPAEPVPATTRPEGPLAQRASRLIGLADRALLSAKANGRNRVQLFQGSPCPPDTRRDGTTG